jgi:threonine aldolase
MILMSETGLRLWTKEKKVFFTNTGNQKNEIQKAGNTKKKTGYLIRSERTIEQQEDDCIQEVSGSSYLPKNPSKNGSQSSKKIICKP